MDITKLDRIERAERNGVWFDFDEGARLKIARAGNRRFQEALRARLRERSKMRDKPADDADETLFLETLAESVLVDWDGFTSNGQPLPYSREAALDLLTRFQRIRDFVMKKSDEMERFTEAANEEAEKN